MRCAIYTRKSNEERLDAEYSSLENQRAYCSAYIASQGGDGWVQMDSGYDDGGYSGGTLVRPALARLRADILSGQIDMVVVYKIDRLSRSLRDFANLVKEFEDRGVAFASVTQAFDTSTSMGRLTLNVLLSFAQFERELTGERLRDWFAGAVRRGLWMHGTRPMGYQVVDGHLHVFEPEAQIVRLMYKRYPKLGSTRALAEELTAAGHLSHRGLKIGLHFINRRLTTRLYLGEMPHRGGFVPGHHAPLVSERDWQSVQKAMAEARTRRRGIAPPALPPALKGLIFGPSGHAMAHMRVRGRNGQCYRYYISTLVARYGPGSCPAGRLRAPEIEDAVYRVLDGLMGLPTRPRSQEEHVGLVRRLVKRLDVGVSDMQMTLCTGAIMRLPLAGRITETRRTANWWRAPEIVAAITADRPAAEIAAAMGISEAYVGGLRHRIRAGGLAK